MIRAYHPQDLATVLSIWLQGNLDAHPFVPVDYWRKNYALTAQLLPQAEVYVAEVHGQVVGFLGLMEELVAGVFVDRAHRGAGLGSALLRQAQTLCPEATFTLEVLQAAPAVSWMLEERILEG